MSAKSLEFVLYLDAPPDQVWDAVTRPALFLHVAAPLVHFSPLGDARFPDVWSEGEYRAAMKLFGVLPFGWQAIVISFPKQGATPRVMEDRGFSPILPVWSHRIEVCDDGCATRYVDRIEFDAGLLNLLAGPAITLFFKHRHRRLKALAADQFNPLR